MNAKQIATGTVFQIVGTLKRAPLLIATVTVFLIRAMLPMVALQIAIQMVFLMRAILQVELLMTRTKTMCQTNVNVLQIFLVTAL